MSINDFNGTWKFQCELVEKWSVECPADTGDFGELGERELRLREVLLGHFAQSLFAKKGQVHGGGESAKRLIGADIGGGLFAADMLLAGGESQNKAAAAFGIAGLTGETTGHLPDELVARGDYSDKRSAVTWRQAKTPPFQGDDIGFGGGPDNTQRHAFGDGHDEQRARGTRDFRKSRDG